MHRLSSLPGADTDGPISYVEQPTAPVLFLTSASSDISALARVLDTQTQPLWQDGIRALPLDALSHPAQIDHYLALCTDKTQLIVIRLLGGRGHWSYGLEQCCSWLANQKGRQLLVLAGTQDQDSELHPLSSQPEPFCDAMARLLREGGADNLQRWLDGLEWILSTASGETSAIDAPSLTLTASPDPDPYDWRQEEGSNIGVLFYRAHRQSADVHWCDVLLETLRAHGLAPKALWVSSLRDPAVQRAVKDLYRQQAVELVITSTSFASVQFSEAGLGAPLWDDLDRPVLQMLSSGRSREHWQDSFQGLDPIDLSLQVVLPELDGRITTRIGAFREVDHADERLCTAVKRLEPDIAGLSWIAEHARAWVDLRSTQAEQRSIALVLANYPLRNGRLAIPQGVIHQDQCN